MDRKMDLLILEKVWGIKPNKIHYQEWDDKKECPEYIPSGKPWRTHQIDAKPVPYFSTSPGACYELKLKLIDKYHWEIKSPFLQGEPWFAGLTPLNVTGWNGNSDYQESGETEMEAVCKVVLKLYEEV